MGPAGGVPLHMKMDVLTAVPLVPGRPLRMFPAVHGEGRFAIERLALIVPTSLCSSQVSVMLARRLSAGVASSGVPLRVLALPHTEGCGHSAGASEEMFIRTMLSYARHPMVAMAVLVEHGCEKTHNDRMAETLRVAGVDPARFGYASIQLGGGIEAVQAYLSSFFQAQLSIQPLPQRQLCSLGDLHLGLVGQGKVAPAALRALSQVAASVLLLGGTCVIVGDALDSAQFLHCLLDEGQDYAESTLGYGQLVTTPGLHRMHCTSKHFVELATGLGASGVDLIIALVTDHTVEVRAQKKDWLYARGTIKVTDGCCNNSFSVSKFYSTFLIHIFSRSLFRLCGWCCMVRPRNG